MNRDQFKSLLQRDKTFLKELYESDSFPKSKRLLNFANDNELNTLIKYIHFISNGEIKIKKENFQVLSTKHVKLIRKKFETKSTLQKLLQDSRKAKTTMLNKLLPVLSNLLTPLFKE